MFARIAYIILGIGITAYTYYVTTTVDVAPALYVFFLVGFGLVVYGAFSLIKAYVLTEDEPTPQSDTVITCPECGVKHYATSNYCHKCGTKL
jgi:uncharacterized paraquat-inducible protein A